MGNRSLHLLGALVMIWLCSAEAKDEEETIYDVLRAYGLPIGLLPKGVKSYELYEGGVFEVNLDEPCYTRFENPVMYHTLIKGKLSYGQIGGLSGVEAKELFLWFPVKNIKVDVPTTGFIYFDVGVVYKQFSLSLFESSPDCKNTTAAEYVPRKALQ